MPISQRPLAHYLGGIPLAANQSCQAQIHIVAIHSEWDSKKVWQTIFERKWIEYPEMQENKTMLALMLIKKEQSLCPPQLSFDQLVHLHTLLVQERGLTQWHSFFYALTEKDPSLITKSFARFSPEQKLAAWKAALLIPNVCTRSLLSLARSDHQMPSEEDLRKCIRMTEEYIANMRGKQPQQQEPALA